MLSEPVENDIHNPLVSVCIYHYREECLRRCFDAVFTQSALKNIEVIFIDDASTTDSWDIALEYQQRYHGLMTIKRNSRGGDANDRRRCLKMARGKYVVTLCEEDAFISDYISQCIAAMEADPYASFEKVKRKARKSPEWPGMKGVPRVNIPIYNYNYGRYLRECFESVFAQTYPNIGVIFSDNASNDDSWDIANEFALKHPGMMTIVRNRKNFGPAVNMANCYHHMDGKYYCLLCSDDALMPDFASRCVETLETYPDAGFAMTHRFIMDERGSLTDEAPFYNQSCLIPGPEQAAVYMMAAVNPSISQIMYNRLKTVRKPPSNDMAARWFGSRMLDFNVCCEYPMLYLKEPLLRHRLHSGNDSSGISNNLVEVFGQYILQHQFADIAAHKGNMSKVVALLPKSLEKVSRLCLRYCARSLCANDERCALRYFHLSAAIMPEITDDAVFKKIQEYWLSDAAGKLKMLESLRSTDELVTRRVSYDPPPGSMPIGVA